MSTSSVKRLMRKSLDLPTSRAQFFFYEREARAVDVLCFLRQKWARERKVLWESLGNLTLWSCLDGKETEVPKSHWKVCCTCKIIAFFFHKPIDYLFDILVGVAVVVVTNYKAQTALTYFSIGPVCFHCCKSTPWENSRRLATPPLVSRQMTPEKWVQNFHTDDASLPRSG